MRVNIVQHVPFEAPGAFVDWASDRAYTVSVTEQFRGDVLPRVDAFDWLVVLGGPMSANDALPWLRAEEELILAAIAAGRRVVGVCLGAQLIAKAFGSRVYRAQGPEIGWFPVSRVAHHGQSTLFDGLPDRLNVYHWHGETFDLPAGALRLAESEICPNQAFQIGGKVLGLQFHLEATPETIGAMIHHCGAEIGSGRFEQPPRLHLGPEASFDQAGMALRGILDLMARDDAIE